MKASGYTGTTITVRDRYGNRSQRTAMLLFPNRRGNIQRGGRSFYDLFWYPLLDAAGFPRRGYHPTRHSFATTAIQRGVLLPKVQRFLGHASIDRTIKSYYDAIDTEADLAPMQDVFADLDRPALPAPADTDVLDAEVIQHDEEDAR